MVNKDLKKRRRKASPGERAFRLSNGVILSIVGAITALPFLYVFIKSLISYQGDPVTNTKRTILGFKAYAYIFEDERIFRAFILTVFEVIVATILHVAITLLAAYALSKKHLRGRKAMLIFVLITMIFGGGLIPYYILITQQLDIDNTILVYILPGLVSGFNIIIAKNFFLAIPTSIEEAARIDGASDFQILWSVVLPLCKPIIATIALWFAVGKWNDYMTGMLYMTNSDSLLIQNVLRDMLIDNSGMGNMLGLGQSEAFMLADNIKMAVIIIATIPIVCVYPFVQKYFIHGVMLGSVKE